MITLPICAKSFSGEIRKSEVGGTTALRVLLEQLRSLGMAPVPEVDCSAAGRLAADFARYLQDERSLSEASVLSYCPVARLFISDRFDTNRLDLARLSVADLHAFVFRHVRAYSIKRMQLMLSGLRSFLRFLYLRGEIP